MRVLDDAFAYFEGQVQPAELRVAKLKVLDDPQCLKVVVEEVAVAMHGVIERALARVAEGRMPNVVHQRQRFDKIDVEIERGRDGARDLRHLDGVRQASAKVVGVASGKDLRLVLEPPKGTGVDDAVAIALKGVAVGMRGSGWRRPRESSTWTA